MISSIRSPMGVYRGIERIGEIEDHHTCVLAFRANGNGRVALGRFDDRKAAMRAVSDAYKAGKKAAAGAPSPDGLEAA